MDPEQLFIESCCEIEARLREGTLYALVKATGILRLLFVDDIPLAHQVNRIHRLKLSFAVIDSVIDWDAVSKAAGVPKPDFEFLGDQLAGTLPPGLVRKTLTLGQFLDLRFCRVNDTAFSVRRVVQFMANVRGGVHLGTPDAKQQLLIEVGNMTNELGQHFGITGLDPVLVATRGIARATLNGLAPLIAAVIAKRPELAPPPTPKRAGALSAVANEAPANRRTLLKMGKVYEVAQALPPERGAWTVGLICPPIALGGFRAIPPMKFDLWANAWNEHDLQSAALALGYGACKEFGAPDVSSIPPEGAETAAAIILPVRGSEPTVLLRLRESDGSDSMAIYFDAVSVLHFQVEEIEVTLDCGWAARSYGFAAFSWEPGRISITYGATPSGSDYRQIKAEST